TSTAQGRALIELHKRTYPAYWKWSEAAEMTAMLRGYLTATFGWTVHVDSKSNPRSLRNFALQANGAEMLRLSCIFATEAGIQVCAPVHDALLIESAIDRIEEDVVTTQGFMRAASGLVLPGFPLRTDAKIITHPGRYMDPRGEKFWETVWQLIKEDPSHRWE